MRRALVISLVLAALVLVPTAQAAWTTSVTVPASFRPSRSVTFTYAASSSSGLDLRVAWSVDLTTCVDTNADGACTGADANLHDFGAKSLSVAAGASGSVAWSVSLSDPMGAHAYVFTPTCATPCTGQAPTTSDTKRGIFQLAYTNTWTRTLSSPAFVANGSTATVMYNMQSMSPDDQDLSGSATLYTTPNASAERTESTQAISVLANAQQTLTWSSVGFAPIARQQERIVDSTTSTQGFANTTVLDVVLNVSTPRLVYDAGASVGIYLGLAGRGATPDWQGLSANAQLILRNGTFTLTNTTLATDANGTAYATFAGAEDLANVNWTANTTVAWNGVTFARNASGNFSFTTSSGPSIAENLTAIRADLANVSFQGVHLDTLGTHNLLIEIGRVSLIASAAAALIFLIVIASFRV